LTVHHRMASVHRSLSHPQLYYWDLAWWELAYTNGVSRGHNLSAGCRHPAYFFSCPATNALPGGRSTPPKLLQQSATLFALDRNECVRIDLPVPARGGRDECTHHVNRRQISHAVQTGPDRPGALFKTGKTLYYGDQTLAVSKWMAIKQVTS